MAAKTKTINIKSPITLKIFEHDNSKKNFKKEFTGLNSIKITDDSKPDETGFSRSTSFNSNPGTKPQPHKFTIEKKGSLIRITGSFCHKYFLKSLSTLFS